MSADRLEPARSIPRLATASLALIFAAALATQGITAVLRDSEPLSMLWGGATWLALTLLILSFVAACFGLYLECRHREHGGTLTSVVRKLFCCLVLGTVVFLIACQPYRTLYLRIVAGLVGGAFASLLVLEHTLLRKVPRKPRRVLDFVVFNACLMLLASEIGVRAYANARPSALFLRDDDDVEQMMLRHYPSPGALHYGLPYDARGFYDEPERRHDARKLVATIGDSFSVGVVPLPFHYTTVAERELTDVDVYNIGLWGVGPLEYLKLIQLEAKPLRPNAIVVSIFVGNDLAPVAPAQRDDRALRRWFDRKNVLLYLVPTRLGRISQEEQAGANLTSREGSERLHTREEIVHAYPWVERTELEEAGMSLETFRELETQRARAACARGHAVYAELDKALLSMQATCGDIPFAVMLIPDEFQVEDEVWQYVLDGLAPGEQLDRFGPQTHLSKFTAEHGIPLLDLLTPLHAVEPLADGRRHVYHLYDTHLNTRGNEIAGRTLAKFLTEWKPTAR